MSKQLHYGATAKTLHWLIVALIVVQFLIGWLMPDIRRGMQPGAAMTWHVSIGLVVLALIALRLAWRLTHPVAPESTLTPWQRLSSELVHWLLYGLVLATTVTGWLFASFRGWTMSWFFAVPLPMLSRANDPVARAIGRWHETTEWALLILVAAHVAAALVHLFYYRDGVMQRMLPGEGGGKK
jgi:cytochrome b561